MGRVLMCMQGYARLAGFLGDGLSFAGSLCLAYDALFKRKEQAVAAQKLQIVIDFGDSAQNRDGATMTQDSIAEAELAKSVRWARVGAVLLAMGFLLLFLSRLWEL